ncbi:hypothetical protein BUY94_07340 [Mammaliicoccus fleurettii]|nr:hypothetical protein BUY94_07340 [Mammaliicoccus fleurettii]RIL48403.1 hypothetical protein BUY93_10625 [Mammaliicoccus fleurettii]
MLIFLYLLILYVHACLGVWFEPVVSHAYFSLRRQHFTKSLPITIFIQSYDFVRACLPRGMVRACSLSLILFPQASALTKSS